MRYFTAAVFVALAALALQASSPKFFQSSTQADFLKGDVENLSIDASGQLVLGPATELVYETASPFLWSLMPGADGALSALEVLVFPEAMRGTGEGHSQWDLQPGSTMTNAIVAAMVTATGNRELTLRFQGTTQKIAATTRSSTGTPRSGWSARAAAG